MRAASNQTVGNLAAWSGVVRARSGFSRVDDSTRADCVELGRAVFFLPEPREAQTTSWARQTNRFCIFTGYLHNQAELATELRWECRSEQVARPAELILRCQEAWGGATFAKLDGTFACAVWDQPQGIVVCGGDPMRLHPFYYALVGGGFDLLLLRAQMQTADGKPAPVYRRRTASIDKAVRRTGIREVSAAASSLVSERLLALKPKLEGYLGLKLAGSEAAQFLTYRNGDFFLAHQDGSDDPEDDDYLRDRKISLVIFLNDQSPEPRDGCYCGGSLTFYRLMADPRMKEYGSH